MFLCSEKLKEIKKLQELEIYKNKIKELDINA